MSHSSFVKQAAILAAATLFARFIGFLYRLPLTYFIGDEGNALYAVGFQFYLFLLVLSSAGIPNTVSKMVSERIARKEYRNAHNVFRAAMIVSVSLGFVGTVLLWVMAGHFAVWFGYPDSRYAIRVLAPAVLIVAIMATYRGYFQGMNNAVPTALSQVAEQFFNALFKIWLAFILISRYGRLDWAAAGATAGTVIGAAVGLILMLLIYRMLSPKILRRIRHDSIDLNNSDPNNSGKKIESGRSLIKEVISTAFPIILGAAIYSIANFIDLAMVSHRMAASGAFVQEEIEALYGQLTGKFVVLTTLPVSISTALSIAVLPGIAGSAVVKDRAAIREKVMKALRISTLVSVPSAIGLGVLAGPILLMLFPGHPDGAILLQVGSVSIIFLSLVQISTGALQGIGKIMIPVIGAAAGALVKIPLNYVLISVPEINVVGAVISTIACYFVAMVINLSILQKYTGIRMEWGNIFVKPISAALIMGLACYVIYFLISSVSTNMIATLLAIGVGGLVYLIMLMMMGSKEVLELPVVRRVFIG